MHSPYAEEAISLADQRFLIQRRRKTFKGVSNGEKMLQGLYTESDSQQAAGITLAESYVIHLTPRSMFAA